MCCLFSLVWGIETEFHCFDQPAIWTISQVLSDANNIAAHQEICHYRYLNHGIIQQGVSELELLCCIRLAIRPKA